MDRAIPYWEEAWGCSLVWPWSHHTMEECGHPPPSLQLAHLLTFWVRYAKLKPRVWDKTSLWNARERHVSLLGEMLSQVGGGGHQERGEKEAFAALSLLQWLLCQMHWSRASQLHLADGTEQPERSCWEHGAASTAEREQEMRSIMGSKGLLAPPVNLSGVYPFPLLHLEFPLTGGLGTQL